MQPHRTDPFSRSAALQSPLTPSLSFLVTIVHAVICHAYARQTHRARDGLGNGSNRGKSKKRKSSTGTDGKKEPTAGVEPTTFRLEVECANHCATQVIFLTGIRWYNHVFSSMLYPEIKDLSNCSSISL